MFNINIILELFRQDKVLFFHFIVQICMVKITEIYFNNSYFSNLNANQTGISLTD